MFNVEVACFLTSYAIAFGLEFTRLLWRHSLSRWVELVFASLGLVMHTSYLLARSAETGIPPLLSSTHDWMLVLAWLVVVFYVFLTLAGRKLPLGLFLLPVVILLIASAYWVSYEPNTVVVESRREAVASSVSQLAMLHASLLVFGIGGVIVGLVLSMMYLLQHRRLKHRQAMTGDLSLPSLERLAGWNWWAVMISIPLLTGGLFVGVLMALLEQEGPSFLDPFVIANSLLWVVMVVFLVWLVTTTARRSAGKQVAWMTLWAFGFLLVTSLGLQVLTGGHPP